MTDNTQSEIELEQMFRTARALAPLPSDALMARVLDDAQACQPAAPGWSPSWSDAQRDLPRPGVSIAKILLAAIGGWSGVAGLSTAAVVGLWFGISPPAALQQWTAGTTVAVNDTGYMFDSMTLLLLEEGI